MEPKHFESLYPDNSRFTEIKKILEFIKNGNSCQLISFPGTGRSNILHLLTYNSEVRKKHLGEKQAYVHFVYMNFSEVKNRSLFDVNKFIFLSLADSLTERGLTRERTKLHQIFKEHTSFNDELIFFQGLKEAIEYLAIEKKLTIVFLFDRFEEYLLSLTDEFFANLRILRNKAKYRFSAVFSLNRPLENSLEPIQFNQFYEFLAGHITYVSLHDKAGMNFRISYLEKKYNKKLDKKTLENIFYLTSGHGKLTRIALETVFEEKKDLLDKSYFLKILMSKKTFIGALFEIWDFLTPEERIIIKQNETTDFLENIHLTKNKKITITSFKKYLLEKQQKSSNKEKIIIDEKINEIKKGNEVISDKLTSYEFKLLKYLLQNSERIIEREEIINSVWKEIPSTEGVSEQALDQLILRLRKKIEDKPDQPNHILTIKGRGIKFTP